MVYTSIGYHTFTIFKIITAKEVSLLIKSFKKYSKETGDIIIYPTDELKKCYSFEYIKNKKGINKWQLRICNGYYNFKSYVIEATINPKILAGIKDYITAANENYLKLAISNFNIEAKKISNILKDFSLYKIKRIDYCVNFDLNELGINCTPEQMMELIKRSNIRINL